MRVKSKTNRLLVLVFSLIIFYPFVSFSQSKKFKDYSGYEEVTYRYTKPNNFEFLTNTPKGLLAAAKAPFKKSNLLKSGLLIVGTAGLVALDQPMLDGAQQFGRFINLSTNRSIKTIWKPVILGQSAPIEVPTTFSSGLYYIGEGWPSILTIATFYSVGKIKKDYRALQTASQLTQTMINVGIFCQLIKHLSGRESPFVSTKPGGEWRPFTHPSDYAKKVPKYDAFPSGHFATMVGTFTVLLNNYPNTRLLKPIAFTLTSIVAFQMMNNGVHWFSDYPLAFLIGYGLGKYAVNRGRTPVIQDFLSRKNINIKISPSISFSGQAALKLVCQL